MDSAQTPAPIGTSKNRFRSYGPQGCRVLFVALLVFSSLWFLGCSPASVLLVDQGAKLYLEQVGTSTPPGSPEISLELLSPEGGVMIIPGEGEGAPRAMIYRVIERYPELLREPNVPGGVVDLTFSETAEKQSLDQVMIRQGKVVLRPGLLPALEQLYAYIIDSGLGDKKGLVLSAVKSGEVENLQEVIRKGFLDAGLTVTIQQQVRGDEGIEDIVDRIDFTQGDWAYIVALTDTGFEALFSAITDQEIALFLTHGAVMAQYDTRIQGAIGPDVQGMLAYIAEHFNGGSLPEVQGPVYIPAVFSARE